VTRALTPAVMLLGDTRLHYWELAGPAARTVVLLHGLGGDHHGLQRCAEVLQGWRVVVPDLPGSGLSPELPGRHDLAGHADALESLRRHLQVEQVSLVGHSFGAAIALAYARRHPGRVGRLVLLQPVTGTSGTPAGTLATRYTQLAGLLPDALFRRVLGAAPVVRLSNGSIMTTRDRAVRRAVDDQDRLNYRRMSVRAFKETAAALRTAAVVDLVPSRPVPTLVVAGDRDVVVPRRTAAALAARLPGARLLVVPGGHLLPMEDPAATGRIVLDFLSDAGAGDVGSRHRPATPHPGEQAADTADAAATLRATRVGSTPADLDRADLSTPRATPVDAAGDPDHSVLSARSSYGVSVVTDRSDGRARVAPPDGSAGLAPPRFTVVVPAYNEAHFIQATLDSVREQDFGGAVEVIVVDNRSTDDTAAIAAAHGALVLHEPRAGVCWARQRGTEAARGQIIVSTDADTTHPRTWLSTIDALFRAEEGCVAVAGPCRYVDAPPWGRWYALLLFAVVSVVYRLSHRVVYVTATNLAFRKSAFTGYDTSLTQGGDEFDLLRRLRRTGPVLFDRSHAVWTSGRRLNRGLLYSLFVSLIGYYVLGYALNRLLSRPILPTAPAFRGDHPARRGLRASPRLVAGTLGVVAVLVTVYLR